MRGGDLLCEPAVRWEGFRGSCLLLNPRASAAWRDRVLSTEFPDLADHIWLSSSGTSGRTKIVALSRAALEASAAAVNRRLGVDASDFWLNPLPLFHVGGLGIVVRAALSGSRCEFLANWDAREFASLSLRCGATLSSLVPAQVHDIISASLPCPPSIRAVVVGGGVLDENLRHRAAELGWPLLPSYGMTETSSQVATAMPGAQDFSWLPVLDHIEARVSDDNALELRGDSLLTGWMIFDSNGNARWEDPKRGCWFRTNDRAELRDGKLRFLGRLDDLIKIRGELVDVATLERELQARVSSGLVRVDPEPGGRNGFELVVIAENAVAEAEAKAAIEIFPAYARPSKFSIGKIQRSPLGKTMRLRR